MRFVLLASSVLVALFILFTPARASAQTASAPVEHEEWYGYQTLLVDAASLVTSVGVGFANGSAGATLGAGGFVLGGPVVHFAHGRPLTGLADLGLRVGAPVVLATVGALIGVAAETGKPDTPNDIVDPTAAGALAGIVIGGAVGGVLAITLDATVLARTKTTDGEEPSKTAVTWAPIVSPLPGGGMSLGVSGTF